MAVTRKKIEDSESIAAMTRRLNAAKEKRRKKAAAKKAAAKKRDKAAAANVEAFKNFPKTSAPISKERLKKEAEDEEGPKRKRTKRTDDAKAKRKISGRGSTKVMDTSISDKDAMTRKKKKTKGRFGVGSNKTLNGKANVSAEQLKKTGLSLRQYMNQWNKTNKRPTAKKAEDKKVQDTIKTKDFRGPSAIGKADVAPKRKPNVDTYAKGRRETPKMEDPNFSKPKKKDPKYKHHGKKGTFFGDLSRKIGLKYDTNPDMREFEDNNASGGMIGASDMSAKKTSAPKKKKMPQYYMGGGTIKKGKPYAYGGRVAKYKE